MSKCPFCNSESIKLDTPFIDPITMEPKQTFCCTAQEKNNEYAKKRFNPVDGDAPDLEEVSKL